ncbi:uncharacterized protein LOC122970953 [Thunnus albacares]|uniref:uncharacterized protein LOC122970953 n=1 Tax=Thunnus albacares TaxID=8236 RepID=UPI001CF6E728|nr:uncharacterized protein LOC122970953 [Thunnus albacares]
MSYLWIRLSLLCAATILQSSASNGDANVSLKCNDTVEVVAGENVTLNCSIIYRPENNCKGQQYHWSNSHGDIQCNSSLMKPFCGWDTQTYVYLTISNVIEEENYTIVIHTDCGTPKKSIKVRVKQDRTTTETSRGQSYEHLEATEPPLSHHHVITPILGIVVTLAVVGILYFLCGTNRGGQIISRMKKERTQGGDNTEPRNENLLIP